MDTRTIMATMVIFICAAAQVSAQEEGVRSQSNIEEPPQVEEGQIVPVAPPIDYVAWNSILSVYLNADGKFDYSGLMGHEEHMAGLEQMIQQIGSASISQWEEDDQLAFWINAYNILTVKGVLDNYPLDSVLDVTGFFNGIHYRAGGESLTLNDIENERIRAVFNEPRIHFAVNCASDGCPPLRAEAYEGTLLERQLEEQTVLFLQRTTRIDSNTMEIHVSKLFEWFSGDFEGEQGEGSVRSFLTRYLDAESRPALENAENRLVFEEYDWALNAP